MVTKGYKALERLFDKTSITSVSTLSLILLLFPFLTLCFFVHPSFIDDYCFYTKTAEFGLFPALEDWYDNWTGRYSLCFIMSVSPSLISSLLLYRTVLFVMIAGTPFLFFFLLKQLFNHYSTFFYISFTALFSFLFFFQLPSVNEGLYWMTGAIAYQMPILCSLALIILLYRICMNKRHRWLSGFLSAALTVLVVGANEISMVTFDVFLACIILYRYINKFSNNAVLCFILSVSIVCSFFVISAPGNEVRGQLFPMAHSWMQTVKMTVVGLLYYLAQWLAMSLLIATLALYLLKRYSFHQPFWGESIPLAYSLGIFALVLVSGFIVPSWSTGQMPNPRAINILFFIFLLGFFYHIWTFHYFLMDHQIEHGIGKIGALFILFTLFFVTFYPGKSINNNIKTAYVDIQSGKASAYDRAMAKTYRYGLQTGFSKEQMPLSLSWDYTPETYHGCPYTYFKTLSR